jgi:diacylglycerol diphosphate phosphatase / phosphatidate phosphatase
MFYSSSIDSAEETIYMENRLQAFPSGHASSSFAAAVFLSLYLNAKLKVFSDHASHFWAFIVVLTPLILASLVSGSMYTSYVRTAAPTPMEYASPNSTQQHQACDLVFGMVIGLALGVLAYRSTYAAVFDFRYNHIPLPPYAFKTQYSRSSRDCQTVLGKLKERQAAGDDELVFWSWWKQSGVNVEGKEKEMAWLRSIRSVRVTGRELGSNIAPKMRKCSEEPML